MSNDSLAVTSALVTMLALGIYIALDGFDLGVGMLLPFARGQGERDQMIESIEPVWDGNETWLILAGVSLWAAFPVAYGTLLPAFYIELVVMLLCLGLRGVSFEFRQSSETHRAAWDSIFAIGSTGATACQGVILAGLVNGVPVERSGTDMVYRFAGSSLDAIRPMALLGVLTLILAYAMLGAAWLRLKTTGLLRTRSEQSHVRAALTFMVSVFVLAFFAHSTVDRFRAGLDEHAITASALAVVAMVSLALALRGKSDGHYLGYYAWSALAVVAALLIVASGLWPAIVPYDISLLDAAAPRASQAFMLIGTACVLPVILAYSYLAYWVFRKRVGPVT